MAIMKEHSKRVIAFMVTIALLLGALFTGAISAAATSLADGLTAVATTETDGGMYKDYKTVEDISGGGIKYTVPVNNGAYSPYVHNANMGVFPGNGVSLQFANYQTTSNDPDGRGYRQFMIVLASNFGSNQGNNYRLVEGAAGIIVDTNEGKLLFVKGLNSGISAHEVLQTLASDTALLYDNFTGKPFTVDMYDSGEGNGDIVVKVTVDEKEVLGKISHTKILECAKWPAINSYISLSSVDCNGGNNPMSIEYYGYKVMESTTPVFAEGLTAYASLSTKANTFPSWPGIAEDITSGGVRYTFWQNSAYYPYAYNVNMGGYQNNFMLQFANYRDPSEATSTGHGHFLLILSSSCASDSYYKFKTNVIGVDIDTVNGKVDLVQSNSASIQGYAVLQNIITDEDFLYENFTAKPFSYTFTKDENGGGILLTVKVGDSVHSGVITYENMAAIADAGTSARAATASSCYISFGAIYNSGLTSQCYVDFYGYKAGVSVDAFVIDSALVDDLTATATASDDLMGAASYRTVTDIDGGGVNVSFTNYSGYGPYGYKTNMGVWPGNGFKLQFADYRNYNTDENTLGNGIVAVALTGQTANDSFKLKTNVPFLELDTVNGTLKLKHGNSASITEFVEDETIITNDGLKAANLKSKPFSITVKPKADGNYTVIFEVAGTEYSGTMTHTLLFASLYHPTAKSTYISIGGIDNNSAANNSWSVNFYGYKLLAAADEPDYTEGLTTIATKEKDNYPVSDTYKTVSDISTGGVKIKYQRHSAYMPYTLTDNLGAWPANGFRIQFAKYVNDNTDHTVVGDGLFAIVLSGQKANDKTKLKTGVPFLLWDTNNGDLKLAHATAETCQEYVVDETIVSNAGLKAAALGNAPFSVTIKPASAAANSDYTVTVNVNSTEYSGTMTHSLLFAQTFHPTTQSLYVAVGGVDNDPNNYNYWGVNFYGVEALTASGGQTDEPETPDTPEEPGTDIDLTEGLTIIATKANDLHSDSETRTVTDITGGGIKYAVTTYSADAPYTYNASIGSWPADGYRLQFNNYVVDDETDSRTWGYRWLAIGLSGQTANDKGKLTKDVPFLLLDTDKGKLALGHGKDADISDVVYDDETIITNDLLKYENITGKPFSITIKPDGDDLAITVDVNGTKTSGAISAATLSAFAYAPTATATYISLGSVDNDKHDKNMFSFEFYGVEALSNKPDEPEQPDPTPQTDLTEGLTGVATTSTQYSPYNSDPTAFEITDIENGGVKLKYRKCSSYYPYRLDNNLGAWPSGGYTFQFFNYKNNNEDHSATGDGLFAIILSGQKSNDRTKLKTGVPFLLWDTNNGNLKLAHATGEEMQTYAVDENIISDDGIKAEALAGKAFTVTIKPNGDNFDVTVNVDGAEFAGIMTAAKLNAPTYSPVANATYVAISGLDNDGNNINRWQIDFYGYIKYEAEGGEDPGQTDPTGLAEGLTDVATLAKEYQSQVNETAYSSYDINGGGVKFSYNKLSAYFPYRFNSNIGPWGTPFMLQFSNYQNLGNNPDNDSDGQIAIVLSGQQANDKSKVKAGVPFLQIDTNEGTMRLMMGLSDGMNDHESQYVIMRNDALKKANIEGKPFTVTVYKAQGSDNVSVEFACGDNTVYGEVPETKLMACTFHPTVNATYISVGGTDNNGTKANPWEIEFYGYKVLDEVPTPPAEWEKPQQDPGTGEGVTNDFTVFLDEIATVKNELDRKTVNYRTVTDIEGGGVQLDFINNSAYLPYRFKPNLGSFPGSGIELWFNNYANKNDSADHATIKGDGQIMILFTSTTANDKNKPKTGVPFLVIDTNKGTLELWHGTAESTSEYATDEVILTNDALKYENFTGKPFKVIVKNDKDTTDYAVTVEIDDTAYTGIMHADKFNALEYHPTATSTYVSVGGPESNDANAARKGFSLEFYGFKRSEVELPDYALGLSEYASTATNANTDIRAWWSTTDYSSGGVHFNCFQLAGYEPYVFNKSVGSFETGFKLVFANYSDTSPADSQGHGQFLVMLTGNIGSDGFYKFKDNVVGININTVDGKVELVQSDSDSMQHYQVMQEIIVDDIFKYDNFVRKGFSYTFKNVEGSKDIKLDITVGDTTLSGVIDYEKFSTLLVPINPAINPVSKIPTGNTTYISFGGIANVSSCYCDVDFYGYQNFAIRSEDIVLRGTADEVEELISALPATATEDNAAQILSAKAKYDALSDKDKKTVDGVETLNALYEALDALRQTNKLKPRTTYLALKPEEVSSTVANPFGNPGARTLFSNETNEGFHINWRGASYVIAQNMRVLRSQAIQGSYNLDGLRVILENYQFDSAPADFIVHFTSGEYSDLWNGTQKIADREIAIRMGGLNKRVELAACALLNPWYAGATDLLTRENLRGKTITVEWHKVGTDYICYISVADEVVAITMSAAEMAGIPNFDPEHVSVIIGTESEKNVLSMDVTGISAKLDPATVSMMQKIDNLPATISSQADVDAVNTLYEEYLKLTVDQMVNVLNIKEFNAKRYSAQAFGGVDEQRRDAQGYTIINTIQDIAGDVSKNSKFSWAEDIETENGNAGVHLDFNNGGYGLSNYMNRIYVTDGISLRFNNFNFAEDSGLIVGVENCSQDGKIFDHSYSTAYDGIWLLIGKNNTIYSTYSVPGRNYIWQKLFDANEHLSAKNLLNKEFYVSYREETNLETGVNTLYMTFTVDGLDFTYHFDEEYMKTETYFNSEEVQVVVHAPCGYDPGVGYHALPYDDYLAQLQLPNICSSMSVDITGFKFNEFSGNQQRAIQEVTELIDALPDTATYDIEETIDDILNSYFHLGLKSMRLAVPNYAKLISLKDQLFEMHLADGTMYPVDEDELENEGEDYIEEYEDYDDYYDYDDYDYEDEDDDDWILDEEYDEDSGDSKTAKKVVRRRLVSPAQEGIPDWLIIVCAAALVVIAGAATMIIILAKRRKKQDEEEGK